MEALRHFLLRHRTLAAMLLAASLCVKAVAPAGYMPGAGARLLTVGICADATGGQATRQIAIPAKSDAGEQHARAKGECAFSVLSLAMIGGADITLLALAFGFILALGFAARRIPEPRASLRLRPPLRGPPPAA